MSGGRNGLVIAALGSRIQGFSRERFLSHRGAHDDRRVGIGCDDLLDRRDSIHPWHDDVHGDQVRTKPLVLVDRFRTVRCLADHVESAFGENVLEHHPHDDGVVDDQHAFFVVHVTAGSASAVEI